MTERKHLIFGDVIRVDPTNPFVGQPDDRRWMVVCFNDRLKWTLMFVGPSIGGFITHLSNLNGFVRAEDDEA